MKCTTLIFIFFIVFKPLTLHAEMSQSEKIDVAVLGGGIGGLKIAYELVKLGKEPIIYTQHLGGPPLKGGFPHTWNQRTSWRHHPTLQKLAASFGCSTADVHGKAKIQDLQCLVQGLIHMLGRDRIIENFQLVEIYENTDPDAPVKIVFRDTQTNQLKTVFANGIEFAMRPDDLKKVKFIKQPRMKFEQR